jgi:Protein of unknown function (DUF3313)
MPFSLHRMGSVTVAALALLGAAAPLKSQPAPSSPFPGLEIIQTKDIDALYRRPGVDMAEYTTIRIGEPVVEFSKNWNPRNYGTFGVSAAQVKQIRSDIAELSKSIFTKILRDGGYEVITHATPGALEITPNIVNLYINAPDTRTTSRTRTYVLDAGSMTLALQINDAITGTLLAVALDQQRGSRFGPLQWATSVSNRAEASAIITGWAQQLKRGLDASRAK